jgi:hypothetical protein
VDGPLVVSARCGPARRHHSRSGSIAFWGRGGRRIVRDRRTGLRDDRRCARADRDRAGVSVGGTMGAGDHTEGSVAVALRFGGPVRNVFGTCQWITKPYEVADTEREPERRKPECLQDGHRSSRTQLQDHRPHAQQDEHRAGGARPSRIAESSHCQDSEPANKSPHDVGAVGYSLTIWMSRTTCETP